MGSNTTTGGGILLDGFGGGGAYGGGGYYQGGDFNYNYHDDSSSYRFFSRVGSADDDGYLRCLLLILLVLGLVVFIVYELYLIMLSHRQWKQKIRAAHAEVFLDTKRANTAMSGKAALLSLPFSMASFDATYTDSSYWSCERSSGVLNFQNGATTRTKPILSISGSGRDDSGGSFEITQGILSPRSGKCYWVCVSGRTHRQVLVTGKLTWNPGKFWRASFSGQWHNQNGEYGFFRTFRLKPQDFVDLEVSTVASSASSIGLDTAPMEYSETSADASSDSEDYDGGDYYDESSPISSPNQPSYGQHTFYNNEVPDGFLSERPTPISYQQQQQQQPQAPNVQGKTSILL